MVVALAMLAFSRWHLPELEPGRPECPEGGKYSKLIQSWFAREAGLRELPTPSPVQLVSRITGEKLFPPPGGQPSLIGYKTDIVEYHDCQELVVKRPTGLGYSGLFAVLARESLDTIYTPPHDRGAPTVTFDDLTMGTPMGLVFSYDSAYGPLNLRRGFNCLYFFRDPAKVWVAKIVPSGADINRCSRPLAATEKENGPTFEVSRTVRTDLVAHDYPPVARWDWDSTTHLQYIGIRCEAAWCEIHPQDSRPFKSSPEIFEGGDLSRPLIKGWYDRQLLAGPGSNGPVVTSIMGTIIPDAHIDVITNESVYENNWAHQATVGIDAASSYYLHKFNFIKNEGDTPQNHLWLCHNVPPTSETGCPGLGPPGFAKKCADGWVMRISQGSQANPRNSKFFCVIRRGHVMMPAKPGTGMVMTPHITGTARWRWLLKDDTMWSRCVQGCCEVK